MTPDENLSAARQRLIAVEREVDTAVRAVVRDRVRKVYPEAHTLVAEGEWNEDGLLHLHVQKVLDAEGAVLDGYDEDGVSLSGDWDALSDEVDALLDEIAERDDSYQGTHEFEVSGGSRPAATDKQSEGPHGHCDTCGALCDEDGCTRNRRHLAALTGQEKRCRRCEHPYVEVLDSPGVLVHLNQDGVDHDQDADHAPVPRED